jgi:hypothetical protein
LAVRLPVFAAKWPDVPVSSRLRRPFIWRSWAAGNFGAGLCHKGNKKNRVVRRITEDRCGIRARGLPGAELNCR